MRGTRTGYVHILARPPPRSTKKPGTATTTCASSPAFLFCSRGEIGKRNRLGVDQREIAFRVRGPAGANKRENPPSTSGFLLNQRHCLIVALQGSPRWGPKMTAPYPTNFSSSRAIVKKQEPRLGVLEVKRLELDSTDIAVHRVGHCNKVTFVARLDAVLRSQRSKVLIRHFRDHPVAEMITSALGTGPRIGWPEDDHRSLLATKHRIRDHLHSCWLGLPTAITRLAPAQKAEAVRSGRLVACS